MENDKKVLEKLNKGVKMGMDAISYVSDKVADDKMKNMLKHEYSMYNNILDKVNQNFEEIGMSPENYSVKDKAMLWYGIQLNTIKDKSNSKIAELLIQGTSMGVVEGKRLIDANSDLNSNIKTTLDDFVQFQEESIEKLKNFL